MDGPRPKRPGAYMEPEVYQRLFMEGVDRLREMAAYAQHHESLANEAPWITKQNEYAHIAKAARVRCERIANRLMRVAHKQHHRITSPLILTYQTVEPERKVC